MADENALMAGRNILDSFTDVLAAARQKVPSPDLVILSGDLSHDEDKADYLVTYTRLAKMLKQLFRKTICIPGNHDDIELVKRIFPLYDIDAQGTFSLDNWQFILVDSSQMGIHEGWLAETELGLLDRALKDKNSDKNSGPGEMHNLVVIHHPVVELNSAWLDRQRVGNADKLFELLARKKNVQGIICGHAHQAYDTRVDEIKIMGTPATCPRQFTPLSSEFSVDESVTPGFRCLDLYPDGNIKTRVCRL